MSGKIEGEIEIEIEMSPEAKSAKAEYLREWRKKNPGKQREYNARSWEKKARAMQPAEEPAEQENKVKPEGLNFNEMSVLVQAVAKRNSGIEDLRKICEKEKANSDEKLKKFFDDNPKLWEYLHSNFDMSEILPDFDYVPF
ncbi:MAG: hypothetical protein V3G42_00915 [Oscillospiraceae bacterium]